MEWKVKSRARASGEEQYAGHGMHDGNAYSAQYVCRTHLSMGRVESDCLGVWVSTLALYNTIIFSPICRTHLDLGAGWVIAETHLDLGAQQEEDI